MKRLSVLTIAASDSCGGAGIQADLKTFLALGVHGASVLTAVTVQNTKGVRQVHVLPAELVQAQLKAVLEDLEIKWGKTGILFSAEIIRCVRRYANRVKLVVDPILRASTGRRLIEEDALSELLELAKRAWMVTPNLPEAEVLAGMRIRSRRDMIRAAKKLVDSGIRAVVIKGGHLPGKTVVDVFHDGERILELRDEKIQARVHGSGCIFSAALVAGLSKGFPEEEAVRRAVRFTRSEFEKPLQVGGGAGVPALREVERAVAVESVYSAARQFVEARGSWRLVPEVGTNIVMAPSWARDIKDVVGLEGRIVRAGRRAVMVGFPTPGGSEHIARAVLSLMNFDPSIRAGMNVRYWEGVRRRCEELGLKWGEFDRKQEPPGRKTLEWGPALVVKRLGQVPQVILDRGGAGKEPMVRVFGRDPEEVVRLALKLMGPERKEWGE